jgi:peptide/nickel transport system permease protein
MWKTVLRRVLIMIPQLFFISLFVFWLATLMPGDAISGLINPNLPMEVMEQMREDLGLNRPWYVRYFEWIGGVVRGDFGMSFRHSRPVLELIGDRLQITFFLSLFTLILTYLIAIPLGVTAGRRSGTVVDKAILIYVFVALAMPVVVLAILMVFWFSPIGLGIFPMSGSNNVMVVAEGTPFQIFIDRIYHLMLPAITGALVSTIGIIFMLRANIIERKSADYVTFARSKGVPTGTIFGKHILRNSLVPVVASIGLIIVGLFAGAIFVERVFGIPGMGRLFIDSINERDFTVVNGIIIIISALTAIGVLLSDIILSAIDPRIRIR